MIENILPACVVAIEKRHDYVAAQLFPEEERTLGRAVDKRRSEFTTGRACARAALERLGFPPVAIPTGDQGEPKWPAKVVGSITHCDGYRACAVARSSEIATLGIDAEPNAPLPRRTLGDIARPEEMSWLRQLQLERPEMHWDRLLFSAKESVYKAWFPLTRRWLGFEDAVVAVDPHAHTFAARLLVAAPSLMRDGKLGQLSGRWLVRDGIIATAIALTAINS